MARRKSDSTLPLLLVQTWFAAAETVARRVALMTTGQCPPAEYQRMWTEKWSAAMRSGLAAALPGAGGAAHAAAVLAPWRRKARANARRLRRG